LAAVAKMKGISSSLTLKALTLLLLAAWVAPRALSDSATILPAEAINHVGQMAIVCGRVASAKFAANTNGKPTFLNLDKPFPNHIFTAVIWGKDRPAFSYAPESLADRRICVSGTIEAYNGRAEIKVSGPGQIQTRE
jgi:hypothetical protein